MKTKIAAAAGAFMIGLLLASQISLAAVYFNGITGLFNPGMSQAPVTSTSLVCHVWLRPQKEETMNIAQAEDPASSFESFHLTTILYDAGDMRVNLYLYGPNGESWELLSQDPLAVDGIWHNVGFAADVSLQTAAYIQDFRRGTIDPTGTILMGGTGWSFAVQNQKWYVGANHTNNNGINVPLLFIGGKWLGSATEAYFGDMEQLYCNLYDGAYLTMAALGQGHGFSTVVFQGTTPFAWGPVDLGPDCTGPTGGVPLICMEGGAAAFRDNRGGATAFTDFGGVLTTSTTSPWDLWFSP